MCIFANGKGVLAQLARALAWHARGQGFDSLILHLWRQTQKNENLPLFSVPLNLTLYER